MFHMRANIVAMGVIGAALFLPDWLMPSRSRMHPGTRCILARRAAR